MNLPVVECALQNFGGRFDLRHLIQQKQILVWMGRCVHVCVLGKARHQTCVLFKLPTLFFQLIETGLELTE